MSNRIHLKGSYRHEEAIAGAAGIYPGMLVMLNSSGEVVVHATAGGWAEKAFAEEDALQGHTIDTVYEDDSVVSYVLPEQGGEVNVMLKEGYDYSIGTQLVSAGDGTLMPYDDMESDGTVLEVLAVCTEALDLTVSGAEDIVSPVRVL